MRVCAIVEEMTRGLQVERGTRMIFSVRRIADSLLYTRILDQRRQRALD
jgi:hypothetical protein